MPVDSLAFSLSEQGGQASPVQRPFGPDLPHGLMQPVHSMFVQPVHCLVVQQVPCLCVQPTSASYHLVAGLMQPIVVQSLLFLHPAIAMNHVVSGLMQPFVVKPCVLVQSRWG